MDFRRVLFPIIVMLGSAAYSAAAVQQQPAVPAGKSTVPAQVDPASDLAKLYPQAGSIGLALAIVPDPHIPRYRRLFDLEVQAITLGMLNDGYVLDRYSFPWSSEGAIPDSEPTPSRVFTIHVRHPPSSLAFCSPAPRRSSARARRPCTWSR